MIKNKKLSLNKTTVRALTGSELAQAGGGGDTYLCAQTQLQGCVPVSGACATQKGAC